MSSSVPQTRRHLRIVAALFGTVLLSLLVVRAGSDNLLENAKSIGWGILLVLGLAGISHIVRTWAWRLTLPGEFHKVSFSRTLGLRLVSEAIGQFGFVGQVLGDATRVSLLTSELPASGVISSVALDRSLFMLNGLIVTIAGLVAVVVLPAVPHTLRLYGAVFAIVLLAFLGLSLLAVRGGWPVLSKTARAARRVPWLGSWLQGKESIILSAEQQQLNFYKQAPAAFWASTVLNFVAHGLAIAEVYLIFLLMGSRISVLGALMLEALTKLINAIGTVNPGNVGTYEGGNMAIVKLVGLTGSEGLTLGLCRRFRSIFWAAIGGMCLLYYSRSKQSSIPGKALRSQAESRVMLAQARREGEEHSPSLAKVTIVLANEPALNGDLHNSILAEVGALPVVLRAILSATSAGSDRIVVAVNPISGPRIRQSLARTGRLPSSLEWIEGSSLPSIVKHVAADAERVVLIEGDRSFHPSLYRTASEWNGSGGALELTSGDEPIGMTVLSRELALDITRESDSEMRTVDGLHAWIVSRQAETDDATPVYHKPVTDDMWQSVGTPQDRAAAEQKLDQWLVKPTDGIFARMNRRISIPISRQLIRLPITPNMVSLFTLLVSFMSGVYFAYGGYLNTVLGALLSVWASILDGSDGEVARLKLQASNFGAWLETFCDYLYYVFIFVGMTIGLVRSTGKSSYLTWGATLLFGAIATFIFAALGRKRLSGRHPEQYLAVFQKQAESQLSNPLAYIGRHVEFIVRRCFLPYAILAFALLNLTWIVICIGAIGANLAWIISLHSLLAFSANQSKSGGFPARSAPAESP